MGYCYHSNNLLKDLYGGTWSNTNNVVFNIEKYIIGNKIF